MKRLHIPYRPPLLLLLPGVIALASLITACERRTEPVARGWSVLATAHAAAPGSAATVAAGQSTAARPSGKPLSAADIDFVATAASGNSLEVEASKLALERSKNPAVRDFAQHMVAEHGKVGDELRALPVAASVGNFAALLLKHKDQLTKLRELQGPAFDKAYAAQIGVAAHQDTVSLFQKAADGASDSQTKAFAQAKLPALREHLQMAQTMAQRVGSAAPAAKATTQNGLTPAPAKAAK